MLPRLAIYLPNCAHENTPNLKIPVVHKWKFCKTAKVGNTDVDSRMKHEENREVTKENVNCKYLKNVLAVRYASNWWIQRTITKFLCEITQKITFSSS